MTLVAVIWFTGSDALVARERRARAVVLSKPLQRHARVFAVAGASSRPSCWSSWDKPRPLVVFSMLGGLALWELLCLGAGRAGPHPVAPAGTAASD